MVPTGRECCPLEYTQIILVKCIGPHSLGPIGRLVKFTTCARVCHVEDRMSILFIGQMEFNIPQLRTLPIKRSTCIRVAAMSKFFSLTNCLTLYSIALVYLI